MNNVVCGRRQLGKSTLSFHLAKQSGKGIVIFDPNGQFRNPEFFHPVSDIDDLREALDEGDGKIPVYRPFNDIEEEFDSVAAELWERTQFCLIVDEASQLKNNKWLDRMARLLDTDDTMLVLNVHRPIDIAPGVRSVVNHYYFFRTTHAGDLSYMAELCGEEVSEQVKGLRGEPKKGNSQVLHWNDDVAKSEEVLEPTSWFRDIKGRKENRDAGAGRTSNAAAYA